MDTAPLAVEGDRGAVVVWTKSENTLDDLLDRAGLRGADPRVAVAGAAIVVACLCWAVWRWWPASAPAAPPVSAGVVSVPAEPVSREPTTAIVHVVGRVRRPGVYTVSATARVCDAVEAAGGALGSAAVSAINLARKVADGEQIVVPSKDDVRRGRSAGALPVAGGGTGAAPGGAVDVNSADAALLDTLPGVGPATAAKIIAERESGGPFKSVDDLGRVSGIGPKKLEQLRELVRVR